jgi:hypothetical protein
VVSGKERSIMAKFQSSPSVRRPPYLPFLIVLVVVVAALIGLSFVDATKVQKRVEKPVPENALAK